MSGDFARLRDAVERASELEGASRAAFLDAELGVGTPLRAEADELLGIAARPDPIEPPDPSALRALVDPGAGLAAGARIGGYRIVRRIASGGMGTVFEAEEDAPRRRVALKVMRLGGDPAESTRRFRFEVEVMARLRHPSIARVYASGTHAVGGDELAWYAMEFVEDAEPITEAVRGLETKQRVALFAEVCDAVHHGHQRGVIHRDLKPDNVLVDGDGWPRVIDFGVARAVDPSFDVTTPMTADGRVLGTLPYMSPEQVAGDPELVDVRSDVYALGALLYEGLVGYAPLDFTGASPFEVARRVREEAPRRPGDADARLAGELEAVLLMALEKDPERRYASAAALADDLRRYLAGEPVDARTPGLGYALRSFARTHRTFVAVAAGVLVVALLALAVIARYLWNLARSNERNEDFARRTFERSVVLATETISRVQALAGGHEAATDVVQLAIDDLELLRELAGDDPEVLAQLAEAHMRFGDVLGNAGYSNLGDLEGARAQYELAFEILDGLDESTSAALHAHAVAHRKRGELAVMDGDPAAAIAHMERSLERFEELRRRAPEDLDALFDLAKAHDSVATALGRAGELASGEAPALRALELFEQVAAHPESDSDGEHFLGLAHLRVGALRWRERDFDAASRSYASAAILFRGLDGRLPHEQQHRKQLAYALTWEGTCRQRLGELDVSEDLLVEARTLYLAQLERDPDNAQLPAQLANVHLMLASIPEARAGAEGLDAAELRLLKEQECAWLREAVRCWDDLEQRGALLPSQEADAARFRGYLEACEQDLADL